MGLTFAVHVFSKQNASANENDTRFVSENCITRPDVKSGLKQMQLSTKLVHFQFAFRNAYQKHVRALFGCKMQHKGMRRGT